MKDDNSIKTNNENLVNAENDIKFDSELTDDEKIDIVAARVLKRFKPAFEELAKRWTISFPLSAKTMSFVSCYSYKNCR